MRSRGILVLVVGALAVGAALAGGLLVGESRAAPGTALVTAQELVARYTKPQKSITVPALPKRAKKGLRLGWIGCTVPVCSPEAAREAAKSLGWNFQGQDFTFTPQSYIEAWDRMLRRPPEILIVQPVFPNAVVAKQLEQVTKLKIPTILVSTSAPTLKDALATPATSCFVCQNHMKLSGKLLAAIVAADGGAAANAVYIRDPVLAAGQLGVTNGFFGWMKQFSPNATLATLDISSSGPAAQIGSTVTTYLQTHPDVRYLVFALASFGNGVPQALAAAGLDGKVKIVSRAPQANNIANVASGVEFAEVAEEAPEGVWRAFDAAARFQVGARLFDKSPAGWLRSSRRQMPVTSRPRLPASRARS